MTDIIKKARAIRSRLNTLTATMTDEDALQSTVLFNEWSGDAVSYSAGQRISYNDVLYRVLQPHISQVTWTPDTATSLYTKVLVPTDGTVNEWVQPDSTNPYMTGDKVLHNDIIWISTVDNNVWEPGVYGWEQVVN